MQSSQRKKGKNGRIVLNVSGEVFETHVKTLERFPETLLGNCEKRLSYYRPGSGRYFFDRSRLFFDAILFFYQSNGILQCPPELPISLFEEECRFFELPEEVISGLRTPLLFGDSEIEEREDFENIGCRVRIWNLINRPETSTLARYFAVVSILMIAVAVASICLESLPALKFGSAKLTDNPWSLLDLSLNIWFLLELITSFICAPDFKKFFQSIMSWIDIIAVVPYFVTLAVSNGNVSSFAFVRIVRLFRVFRLFTSITKQSKMLQKLAMILQASLADFKTLIICFAMVVIIGGSIEYFLEAGTDGNMFTDIPTSVYWATVTITTVGYGDYYPTSIQGQLWATCYMFFGALTLCIPIISVITKLEALYEKEMAQKETDTYWTLDEQEQL